MSSNNQNEDQPSPNQSSSENQPQLSIEYSTDRSQPRPPNDLADLLRYAVEAGSNPSGTSPRPLSERDSSFLMNALNSMTVNVSEEFQRIIKTLNEQPEDEQACTEALDSLSEYVCFIDYANDFIKVGGIPILKNCLDSKYTEVRWQTAEIIADIVQNNPIGQNFIINSELYSKLMHMIKNDDNEIVKIKCLYAISCLIRDNEDCLEAFRKQDGFSTLIYCLQSKVDKLIIKSCFLISSLCNDNNKDIKNILYSMGLVEQLCSLISIDEKIESELNEHLLSALLSLIKNSNQAQEQCKQNQLNLKTKLNIIRNQHEKNEKYFTEIEYIDEILSELYHTDTEENEPQDR